MAKNSFYNDIAKTNTMPDGMLNSVKYEDYALFMVLKDKPEKSRKEKDYDVKNNLE